MTFTFVQRRQIYVYFGSLTLLWYLTAPENLADIPTAFILKNHLHATAPQVSLFRLVTGIPLYLCFVPGLLRDFWNPFGLRDRGFFILFAPLTVAVYLWMALSGLSLTVLLVGTLLTNLLFRFIVAAYSGLVALIGQEDSMCGRLSAISNSFANTAILIASVATGPITERLSPSQAMLVIGGVTAPLTIFGLWKPDAIFQGTYKKPQAIGSAFVEDIKRLLKHKAIYPAMLMNFLWYFNPGLNTPMQFHLTEHLHASDATYSYYFAAFMAGMIPAMALYGFLCTRVSVRKLVWWSMALGVPEMIPLLFVHSSEMAVPAAFGMGLLGGMAATACYEVAMRSCPAGLQGTLMMLTIAMGIMAQRGGDLLGAGIYASSPTRGFLYCVLATIFVYAAILVVIPFIPRQVVESSDGELFLPLDADLLMES